ncbi:MAG: hypothetical protein IJG38_05230 [Thermoguttaceae bacterium]|nr:hypothetical protein [Thermoguttaceae bacterium]MBQ6614792.1 hypothetical protein [Thermoguttaceae bacterium]
MTTPEDAQSKEKFNFWRFIRLCSLKDFTEFKQEQSRTATELNSRLIALEEKLDNKTEIIQKSIVELYQTFNNKLDETFRNIIVQINESKFALIKHQEDFVSDVNQQLAQLKVETKQLSDIVSNITQTINQQIASSQEELISSIENVKEDQKSMVEQIKKVNSSSKTTQNKVDNLFASVAKYQDQLNQQTEIHAKIEMMCAELMKSNCELLNSLRILALNSLSGQIELLEQLLPDSSKNNKSEKSPKGKQSK